MYLVSNPRTAKVGLTCSVDAREAVIGCVSSWPDVWVSDVTAVYAHFLLTGPDSRDLLGKLTALNLSDATLPELACAQARIAQVHAIFLRLEHGLHLLVSRDYGDSIWAALLH